MKKPIEMLREAKNQIDQAIDKLELNAAPDVNRTDYNREYELGVQYHFPNGAVFKYGKVDFGSLGWDYDNNNKEIRYIWYRWFAMNGTARASRY